MSYLRKIEYKIIPEEAYTILRNCSVCGCRSDFVSSECFRVNANGSLIDVWLIYHCIKCKHTYNLAIYERFRAADLSPEEFAKFINNDKEQAMRYGTDKSLFAKNKAMIDLNAIKYRIYAVDKGPISFQSGDFLQVSNTYGLRVRTDKVIAELLNISRSRAKQLEKSGAVEINQYSAGSGMSINILVL